MMRVMSSDLRQEIEAFLAESNMGQAYFGKLAANNSSLVSRLRAGESVTLRTAERIRAFIKQRRKEVA